MPRRKRRKYTPEQKAEAVELVRGQSFRPREGGSVHAACSKLGDECVDVRGGVAVDGRCLVFHSSRLQTSRGVNQMGSPDACP